METTVVNLPASTRYNPSGISHHRTGQEVASHRKKAVDHSMLRSQTRKVVHKPSMPWIHIA